MGCPFALEYLQLLYSMQSVVQRVQPTYVLVAFARLSTAATPRRLQTHSSGSHDIYTVVHSDPNGGLPSDLSVLATSWASHDQFFSLSVH